MPITTWQDVEVFLQRCLPLSLTCLGYTVAAFVKEGSVLLGGAIALFIVGLVSGTLLIYSWRHYNPLFPWWLWAVPGPLLGIAVAASTLGPPLNSGAASILGAIFVVPGCWGVGFFGLLLLLRSSIKRWFGT